MLIGVISDIHANIPALYATLDYLDDMGVNSLLVAGDLVGYHTFPDQVIRELSTRSDLTGIVMGNHDLCIAGGIFADRFTPDFLANMTQSFLMTQNFDALAAIGWGVKNIDPKLAQFLLQDNFFVEEFNNIGIAMMHGCPNQVCSEQMSEINSYLPEDKAQANKLGIMDLLLNNAAQILITGHTHLPFRVDIAAGTIVALNPGSVGQPRDGDPRASFLTIEVNGDEFPSIEFHKAKYDISATQQPIYKELELPNSIAERLSHGR